MKIYLAISVGLGLIGAQASAQSTLDKYLKKSTESSSSNKSKTDEAGVNKVYKGSGGYWRLDDTRATGGFCAITFYAAPYYAGYVGPVGTNTESFIVFSGPTIPTIKKEKRKKMTLTTAEGEVQTVQAVHMPNSGPQGGAIILFRLTDIQAAMDGISDVENVAVVMDKKQVFSIKWQGGHIARATMQKCLGTQTQKAGAK